MHPGSPPPRPTATTATSARTATGTTPRTHLRRVVSTGGDHRVTPAELFFDLVFVYAFMQVTTLLAEDPTPMRLLGGGVVLALLWRWCCFARPGSVVRTGTGPLLGVLLTATAAVLVVSLTVPEVFAGGEGSINAPLIFVLCYGALRVLHLVAYRVTHPWRRPAAYHPPRHRPDVGRAAVRAAGRRQFLHRLDTDADLARRGGGDGGGGGAARAGA
ncbi:low temperature requirement protein A [Streptomyces sp. CMB-StM0423]|uniref:low temperature requirement protein A n=1 Tax=Streptomyces sp. CMB-StM0423 TaxID=2059884 RepID=UPI001F357089|nr:low temperature requirement protein A [Streptomyces sp. CMB-StM0423]